MSRKNIEELVSGWVEGILAEGELELVDVEYKKEQQGWVLRVFLDKPGGINIEDCQQVSRLLDEKLDLEDPIPGAYSLEVSSPGIERPLTKARDYERFAGRLAEIRTYSGLYGRKRFQGVLQGLQGEKVLMDFEGETIEIPLQLIAKANLAPDF